MDIFDDTENIHTKMNICFITCHCVDTSYVNGHGKGSFFIVAFNFMKSTQILSFSFFFGTTTIDDNHVASSASCMKHVANNLSMSCSIVVA